jgi:hypothetical protein
MKKKISILIGGLLAVAVLFGAVSVKSVYAQDSTTSNPIMQRGGGHGHGGERGLGQPELEAAAKVLGMTSTELSTALADGKNLEDLATTAKVDIQDVKDAINAVHAEEMRAQITQAVTDGTMTQAKADWLLEGLDKGYLEGPGGFGFGGPHGRGGHPDTQSDTTTAPTAVPTTAP